jgi:hypothetical protein
LHQVLVSANRVTRAHALVALGELQRCDVQKRFHVGGEGWQHGLQSQGQQAARYSAAHALLVRFPFLVSADFSTVFSSFVVFPATLRTLPHIATLTIPLHLHSLK